MAGHAGACRSTTSCCTADLWVADVVYRPLETRAAARARALGCRTLDGGGMAVFQAAGSFELFTGVEPDRERMLRHFAELDRGTGGRRALMRRSIATVCLSGTLEEKLDRRGRRRLRRRRALRERPRRLAALPGRGARAAPTALGLTIDLYQPFRDFEAVADELAATCAARRRKFDVMEQLGAPTLLVCSNVSPAAIDDDALAAEHLHAARRRVPASAGCAIAYEALAWGRHVNDYDHAWRIVAAADHPALGTCLDCFHILSRGSDPRGSPRSPARRSSSCSSPTRRSW